MVTMVTMVTMVIRVAMVAGVTRMTRWTIGYNHADEGILSRLQGNQVGNFQSEKSGGKYDLKIKSYFHFIGASFSCYCLFPHYSPAKVK